MQIFRFRGPRLEQGLFSFKVRDVTDYTIREQTLRAGLEPATVTLTGCRATNYATGEQTESGGLEPHAEFSALMH